MADISMCLNISCRKFKECYRAQAIPNIPYQSYGGFQADTDEKECKSFDKIRKGDVCKSKLPNHEEKKSI